MCAGTARDHDQLHRDVDPGEREAKVRPAEALNDACLEFSSLSIFVLRVSEDPTVQVYPLNAQCWHASEKASAASFVTGNRLLEFTSCSLTAFRS